MNRNRLLWLVFIGVGMFSNVVSSSNVWAGAPKTAQIVFTAYGRDGNQADIYVMDINGGRQRNLTKHAIADEVHPAWSPDGRKIAFVSGRDGNSNIYVMDADGKNVHQLTDHPVSDTNPAWSPNGRKIAFQSSRDGNMEIYVMDADGGNVRRLPHRLAFDIMPAWSPNGRKIAFVSYGDGVDSAIYIMDADGGGIVRLTTYPAEYPVWSPDGRQLAFHSNKNPEGVPNSDLEIYVIDADGENERQLTQNRTGDKYPDWFDPTVPHAVSSIGQRAALRGWLKQLNRRE